MKKAVNTFFLMRKIVETALNCFEKGFLAEAEKAFLSIKTIKGPLTILCRDEIPDFYFILTLRPSEPIFIETPLTEPTRTKTTSFLLVSFIPASPPPVAIPTSPPK
jgi:hypothetical protein